MRVSRGFSLIELMIAVVIVGILASVALPSYQNYVRKSHRSNAQSYMMAIAQKQQQYFLDQRSYFDTSKLADVGLTVPADIAAHYTVAVDPDAGPPPGFTITATPKGKQVKDSATPLTLTHTGAKAPADKW